MVEKLFGRYDYDLRLPFALQDHRPSEQILILYGENGAGKTTLLRLAFHLLNHVDSSGHKTRVARTPFRRFAIELNDGTVVEAIRDSKDMVGSFSMRIVSGHVVNDVVVQVDSELSVPRDSNNPQLPQFLRLLEKLKLALFFVTDDRELLGNTKSESAQHLGHNEMLVEAPEGVELIATFDPERGIQRRQQAVRRTIDLALIRAILAVTQWARDRALSGSQQGETDASSIYANIIRQLSHADTAATAGPGDVADVLQDLSELSRRSADLARLGLPSATNLDKLTKASKEASDYGALHVILQPYVSAVRARLDALDPVFRDLDQFVRTVNSYYVDKRIELTIRDGIRVVDTEGSPLDPLQLSSGEKQLLLLFSHILVATGPSTIVFIDEPELSLNVKWQRKLIRSLLSSTKGRNIQFILATHSFELLTPHRDHVLELRHAGAGEARNVSA